MHQPNPAPHAEVDPTKSDMGANHLEDGLEKGENEELSWTREEERTAVRKLDWCLIPL